MNSEKKAPLSGLDVDSLLNRETPQEITKENAIPAFKQRLHATKHDDEIVKAIKQMSVVICEIVKDSTGDTGYARALENIRIARQEMVELEQPEFYNDFIRNLKQKLLGGTLGEGRKRFFMEIRNAKLGLIDDKTIDHSDVTEEDATKVSIINAYLLRAFANFCVVLFGDEDGDAGS